MPKKSKNVCFIHGVPGTAMHLHHVIPVACGGRRGRTEWLCNDCHEAIHEAAKIGISAEDYALRPHAKTVWDGDKQFENANFLIGCIVRAEEAVRYDPNKTRKITVTLSGADCERLEYIKKRTGRKSLDSAVSLLIQGFEM